jgi:3-oxoadipate enol-lactonase
VPTFAVDGRALEYEVVGDGPAVVLIHSGIADSSLWDFQVEALRDRYRVIRYDVAGYGRSALPSGAFSHLGDLSALLEHIGIERAAVVGNSGGGRLALEHALAHPEAVEKLVLIAPGLSGHEWSDEELQRAADDETKRYEAGDFEGAAESQIRIWVDGPRRSPDEVDPALRERARRMILRSYELYADAERRGEPSAEWLDPPASERLDEIAVPTLVVVGEHEVSDMFAIADRLEAGIPGARKVIVPGTAHLLPLEQPDELNRLLLEFLAAA